MPNPVPYNSRPDEIIDSASGEIAVFNSAWQNIDSKVVEEFGEEWLKFNKFEDEVIKQIGDEYFDIITDEMVNKSTYALDVGCGTGRWTKYLSSKAGFIEATDPSNAIFAASKLLENTNNVRLTRASAENLPFNDETFDFAMAVGVLHHIPNTQVAMNDCVKKIKKGGYFYVYLYYSLDNRGSLYKLIFGGVNFLRKAVSALPGKSKRFACDLIAITVYMPVIITGRFFKVLGLKKIANKMPLSTYHNRNFFVVRNDSLDRFGTRLEQRFSANEIVSMMENAGLTDIVISKNSPYHHAVGRKI